MGAIAGNRVGLVGLAAGIFILVLCVNNVHAYDVGSCAAISQGGPDDLTVTVTSAIHSVGEMQTLYEQFNAAIDRYDLKKTQCRKAVGVKEREECEAAAEALLQQGKDILARLLAQAANIEAEIAVNKKKVGKRLAQKLDRLLNKVIAMRQEANAKMKARMM